MSLAVNDAFDTLAVGTGGGRIITAAIAVKDGAVEFKQLNRWDAHHPNTWVSGLAFDEVSLELVSIGRDGSVTTWNIDAGTATHTWQSPLKWVASVAFIPHRPVAVVYGTLTPGGFIGAAGVVINAVSGEHRVFGTPVSFMEGAYVPALDAMIVVGIQAKPMVQNASLMR
jgi:hypothetical protein